MKKFLRRASSLVLLGGLLAGCSKHEDILPAGPSPTAQAKNGSAMLTYEQLTNLPYFKLRQISGNTLDKTYLSGLDVTSYRTTWEYDLFNATGGLNSGQWYSRNNSYGTIDQVTARQNILYTLSPSQELYFANGGFATDLGKPANAMAIGKESGDYPSIYFIDNNTVSGNGTLWQYDLSKPLSNTNPQSRGATGSSIAVDENGNVWMVKADGRIFKSTVLNRNGSLGFTQVAGSARQIASDGPSVAIIGTTAVGNDYQVLTGDVNNKVFSWQLQTQAASRVTGEVAGEYILLTNAGEVFIASY